ncbi:MAG: hypothetical protein JO262_15830 [Solirubrobacterales bacterium]|nr:hypothetical protein [Solirubrobacterales bacterium]
MKKFGTPIGAGPGSAKENVGLAGVGTPLSVLAGEDVGALLFVVVFGLFGLFGLFGWFGFFGCFGFAGLGCLTLLAPCELPWFVWEGFCPLPFPELFLAGCGAFDSIVVVGVVDDAPWDGFGLAGVDVELEVVVVVVVVVVLVPGGHDCTTLVMGRFTGSGNELAGVPGGTFWKVKVLPPATVMITVQPLAEALGIAARPSTATTDAKVTAAIFSFRLLNTVAYPSRRMPRANSSQLRSQTEP